jgi:hypothetical protein
MVTFENHSHSSFISSALILLLENPDLVLEVGCGQGSHEMKIRYNACLPYKKSESI